MEKVSRFILALVVCYLELSMVAGYSINGGVLKRSLYISRKHQTSVVDDHNYKRAQEPAANMQEMVYSPALAKFAQEWANKCNFEHRKFENRKLPGFESIGENLAASTDTNLSPDEIVNATSMWYEQRVRCNYMLQPINTNNFHCSGHFTQIIWHDSYAVGCGAAICKSIGGWPTGSNGGWLIVCNYANAGNVIGEQPYEEGPNCSQCPENAQECTKNGLCSVSKILHR